MRREAEQDLHGVSAHYGDDLGPHETAIAIAINARLLQAREKPSEWTPMMGPVNRFVTTAKRKAIPERTIRAFVAFDMTYLLTLVS